MGSIYVLSSQCSINAEVFIRPSHALSLAKWMCHVRMKWGKQATPSDQDALTKRLFTLTGSGSDFFFFLFCTSAVCGTDVSPRFHMLTGDDPASNELQKKPGRSAVTTEPFCWPTTNEPITCNDRTLPSPPFLWPSMLCTKSANEAGRFGGAGGLSHPALNTVLNEPNPASTFTHSHTCFLFFTIHIYSTLVSISLTCFIHDRHCCLVQCLCVWRYRKSHHPYSTVLLHSHHHRSAV